MQQTDEEQYLAILHNYFDAMLNPTTDTDEIDGQAVKVLLAMQREARRKGRLIQAEATVDKWQSMPDDGEFTTFLNGQVEVWEYELAQSATQPQEEEK